MADSSPPIDAIMLLNLSLGLAILDPQLSSGLPCVFGMRQAACFSARQSSVHGSAQTQVLFSWCRDAGRRQQE